MTAPRSVYPWDIVILREGNNLFFDKRDGGPFDTVSVNENGEYLEFVGRLYGLDRAVASERGRELLELFELSEQDRKLIAEYSKGMRKRVAMAAALIHRPRLFLLDEPFEGVDAVGSRLMKNILSDQVRRGATVFLTSHVLEVVERLCDEIAIITKGKIVAQGTMNELRQRTLDQTQTLEEIFVELLGERQSADSLRWL